MILPWSFQAIVKLASCEKITALRPSAGFVQRRSSSRRGEVMENCQRLDAAPTAALRPGGLMAVVRFPDGVNTSVIVSSFHHGWAHDRGP